MPSVTSEPPLPDSRVATTSNAAAPLRMVEVMAGVIRDARGRVLLARRTEGRDLAGLWEFPGGKHEPGESAEEALARELHEELGIEVEIGPALITVPQRYPDKRLRLDVRVITAWRGNARGREGQALVWVPSARLPSYSMPPADRPVVAALLQPPHYLVTPAPSGGDAPWLAALEAALASGARRVQLRAPDVEPLRWRALVARAAHLCRQAGAEVLVNADVALAREFGIGVHLPASLLHSLGERPLPADLPVGASCHGAQDLRAAEALACDFAVLGNLRPTPSHPGRAGIGWEGFAALREGVSLPIYAIGGLVPEDLDEARRNGAQGIAAIRGLWPSV